MFRTFGPRYWAIGATLASNEATQLVRGRNSGELLDELTAFPHGAHDDCVDALSGAHNLLVRRGSGRMTVHVPRGRIPWASERIGAGSYDRGSTLGLASPRSAPWYPSSPR